MKRPLHDLDDNENAEGLPGSTAAEINTPASSLPVSAGARGACQQLKSAVSKALPLGIANHEPEAGCWNAGGAAAHDVETGQCWTQMVGCRFVCGLACSHLAGFQARACIAHKGLLRNRTVSLTERWKFVFGLDYELNGRA